MHNFRSGAAAHFKEGNWVLVGAFLVVFVLIVAIIIWKIKNTINLLTETKAKNLVMSEKKEELKTLELQIENENLKKDKLGLENANMNDAVCKQAQSFITITLALLNKEIIFD